MKERYKIVEGSESAHCCFSATILDTHQPEDCTNADGTPYYYNLAECFYIKDAENIVKALHQQEEYNKLWHENMASEAASDMLVDYLYDVIEEDLYNFYEWYSEKINDFS